MIRQSLSHTGGPSTETQRDGSRPVEPARDEDRAAAVSHDA